MQLIASERDEIAKETDVIRVRQRARALAAGLRFSLVDQTKIVTAVSEIARNTLIYGKGGEVTFETWDRAGTLGLRMIFRDQGPGITDLSLALTDGYTTGGGLGLGLTGSRRLMSEFDLRSTPGQGTEVTLTKWK